MKIYNNCPIKINDNFIIKDTEMIKNHSMFSKIPVRSSIYQKLGDEMGMWLIKSGNDKMVFRSENTLNCGEMGTNHLDLYLNYYKNNVNFDLGLFRLICSNGLEQFESLQGIKFKNVMQNKINPDLLINKLQLALPKIENKINKIQGFEIDELTKNQLIHNFIQNMKEDSNLGYLRKHDNMKDQDINNMLRLLSSNDLSKPNRVEDYGSNLWTVYNTIQENTTKIVKQFKHNTMLENKVLLDVLTPIYK